MNKHLWAVFFIIQNGIPMTVTNLSQSEITTIYGKAAIVDKATYDAAVAAIPPFVPFVDQAKVQAITDAKDDKLPIEQRFEALLKAQGVK